MRRRRGRETKKTLSRIDVMRTEFPPLELSSCMHSIKAEEKLGKKEEEILFSEDNGRKKERKFSRREVSTPEAVFIS